MDRRLLDITDPLPSLVKATLDGLRSALTDAETAYIATYTSGDGGPEERRQLEETR